MSTSTVGTVLDALRAALDARAGLDGVNVFSGPVTAEEAGEESIEFGDISFDETPSTMGGNRQENYTVDGELYALKPWQGTTETTIASARDRALAIYAEIESYLNDNPTIGDNCLHAQIASGEINQGFGTDGRGCRVGFKVSVRAIKNP